MQRKPTHEATPYEALEQIRTRKESSQYDLSPYVEREVRPPQDTSADSAHHEADTTADSAHEI